MRTSNGKVALLVASTGGHLAQLHRLRPRIAELAGRRIRWVTFDTPQSRSLLAGEDVVYANFTAPRDARAIVSNFPLARQVLARGDVDLVVSTGSGVALSFLPIARMRGIPTFYIESAARSKGPSVTGRLLSCAPGIHTYAQYPAWSNERWPYAGSVFEGFSGGEDDIGSEPRKLLVTLGTIPFPFPRLVERVRQIVPAGTTIFWQTGATDSAGLGSAAVREVPMAQLSAAMRDCDAIIAHSGIGSALAALESGHQPILVPREPARGEHIDEHQRLIAEDLAGRGLALHRSVDDLCWEDVRRAARRWAATSSEAPLLRLTAA
jgi:UDP-N-acetylglucosamine--N-acetylmuramyl-(pentapeptide) pyrophosphoryl-undecaprenol N-acetylglucosamine transferase